MLILISLHVDVLHHQKNAMRMLKKHKYIQSGSLMKPKVYCASEKSRFFNIINSQFLVLQISINVIIKS